MANLSEEVPGMLSGIADVERMSVVLERLQTDHIASNRAMHELFLQEQEVDRRTQKIFRELVDLMRLVQQHHLRDYDFSDTGTYSAAQILASMNYNYVLKAMPPDACIRHTMIASMEVEALKY